MSRMSTVRWICIVGGNVLLALLFTWQAALCQPRQIIRISRHLSVEVRHLTSQYGYPVDAILSIAEGPFGRLWLIAAEADGLVFQRTGHAQNALWRYDGTEFINFGTPQAPAYGVQSDPAEGGMPLNFVQRWAGDSLLIHSGDNNYYCYDIGEGVFHRLSTSTGVDTFVAFSIYHGTLHLASVHASLVQIWQEAEGRMIPFSQVPLKPGRIAMHVNSTDLWVSFGGNGIYRYTHDGHQIKSYGFDDIEAEPVLETYTEPSFYVMREVNGVITISSDILAPGILRYNAASDRFVCDGLEEIPLRGVQVQDTSGNHLLLYGEPHSRQHLRLDMSEDRQLNLDTLLQVIPGLFNCVSNNLEKYFWVNALDGLHLVRILSRASQTHLAGVSCRAIARIDTGGILVGSETDDLYYVPLPFDGQQNIVVWSGGFAENRILLADQSGLWANNSNELVHMDPSFVVDRKYVLKLPGPEAVARLPDGSFLMGDVSGRVEYWSPEEGTSRLLFESDTNNPLSGKRIHALEPLDNRYIAIGTNDGLFLMDLLSGNAHIVKGSLDEDVISLHSDRARLYAGCFSGSLLVYNIVSDVLQPADQVDIGAAVATITPDTSGNLWLGTFSGLACYHPGNQSLDKLTSMDLAHPESNRHSAYFDAQTNSICIGSVNGLTILDLDHYDLRPPARTPRISLNSVSYFDQKRGELRKHPLALHEKISLTLPATQRYLRVSYHMDDLVESGRHAYQYRISKGGSDWFDLGPTSDLTFHNLDAGHYNIEITGRNARGIQSANTAVVQLHVRNFFYESTWFYLVLVFIAGLSVLMWIIHNMRIRRRLEHEVALRTSELRADKETIEKQAGKLRELDSLKSRFFANISHELRTPLTMILSPLKQARSKVRLNAELRGHLDIAVQNARTLVNRVEELLALSQLEQGVLRIHPVETELVQFLRMTTSNFHSLITQKKIRFTFENDLGEYWYTMLDRRKMEKIVYNLMHNAIKFTPPGGSVTLKAAPAEGGVEICVEDTGRGIPAEDIGKIFDRYFQTSRADAPAEGGTGIGLALVRELTLLQEGKIEVDSEEGKGARFTLFFPFAKIEKSSRPPALLHSEEHTKASAVTPKPITPPVDDIARILVVEDHPDLRSHIAQLLSGHYHVEQAQNGAVALDRLQQSPRVDLILSDVMMPEMDGFELLRRVKQKATTRSLPFCFLTAKAGMEDKISALRLGVDDYILKPFSEEELMARLQNLLANRRSRKAAAQNSGEDIQGESEADALLLRIQHLTLENLDHPQFSIDFLSEKSGIPRRSLHRFILKETGLTPNTYVRDIRLMKARSLLEKREVSSIAELSAQVGFQKAKYFSKIFKERFGKSPSDYL